MHGIPPIISLSNRASPVSFVGKALINWFFHLPNALSPATNYTAKIKSSVLKFSKYNSVKGGDKINFHTPPLTLDNSQVIWMLSGESTNNAMPQIDLYFNYRVNPADIKDKLSVEVEGKKAEFTMISQSPDNKISVRLNRH